MNFTSRTGIKVLVVVVGVSAAAIVAERHLAASPSPVNSKTADSPPRIEVVHPHRATVAQRLQTNATLEAFEEADLFAKVSGYLSDVRVDIGDHVKAGQVLAVIDVPEMKQELAEATAQFESKRSSLESAPSTGPQQGGPSASERPGKRPGAVGRGTAVHQRSDARSGARQCRYRQGRSRRCGSEPRPRGQPGRRRRRNRGEDQDSAHLYADRCAFRWRCGAAPGEPG